VGPLTPIKQKTAYILRKKEKAKKKKRKENLLTNISFSYENLPLAKYYFQN